MSALRVEVSFDGGKVRYRTGEEVTGTVVVTAGQDVDARGVRIRQLWRVHGRGNTDEEVVSVVQSEGGRLRGGMPNVYPFRFTVPARPVSYRGHFINLDHYAVAEVDLAWKLDPRGEADYVVLPGAGCRDGYMKAAAEPPPPQQHTAVQKILGWLFLPVIVVLLLALLVILLPILFCLGVVKLGRMALAERRLGEVTLEFASPVVERDDPDGYRGFGAGLVRRVRKTRGRTHVVSPGEALPLSLRFTPRQDVHLIRAEVRLEGQESTTSGSGTTARTHTHKLCDRTLTLLEPGVLARGVPVDVGASLLLPQTDAMSFKTASSSITWTATVRIEVPGWPDWVRKHDLLLVPATGAVELRARP